MNAASIASEIEERAEALPLRNAPALRALRREYSRRLKSFPPGDVLAIALELLDRGRVHRFFADELIANRPDVLRSLRRQDIERLGKGITSWDQVDCFACYLAGPAWREGQLADETIVAWAHSPDLWWRRAALVSTVPLNVKARGGHGDTERTLMVCRLLVDDRDDMVVKALSWALRALSGRNAEAVRRFTSENEARLAPRVRREVATKLATGLKNPKRKPAG